MDLWDSASHLETSRSALSATVWVPRPVCATAVCHYGHPSDCLYAFHRVHGRSHRPSTGNPSCPVLLFAIHGSSFAYRSHRHPADTGELAPPVDGAGVSHCFRAVAGVSALHSFLYGCPGRTCRMEQGCAHWKVGHRLDYSPAERARGGGHRWSN